MQSSQVMYSQYDGLRNKVKAWAGAIASPLGYPQSEYRHGTERAEYA